MSDLPNDLNDCFHVWAPFGDSGDYALLSDSESVWNAVVFVHGFLGGPSTTWGELEYRQELLETQPFRESDLFFFAYPAEDDLVDMSSRKLRKLVDSIFPVPPQNLFDLIPQKRSGLKGGPDVIRFRTPPVYRSLVLVGHSLGCVVIRRMIADLAVTVAALPDPQVARNHVLHAQLRFFAPADLGFDPSGVKGLFSPLLSRIGAYFPAFQSLKPDCELLRQTRRETEQCSIRYPEWTALRSRRLFGEEEDVVVVGRYDNESPGDLRPDVPARDHIDICKTTKAFKLPVQFIGEDVIASEAAG